MVLQRMDADEEHRECWVIQTTIATYTEHEARSGSRSEREGVILHVCGGERRKGVRKQWLKVKLCCELTHTPESLAYQTALYAGSRRDRTREARKRSVRRCHCKRRVVHGRGKMSLSRTRTSGWAQEVSRRVWTGEGLGMARGNGPRHEHATGFGTGLVPEPCSCRTSHYQG